MRKTKYKSASKSAVWIMRKPEPATLKMFVWRNILVDYTGGIAIALAKNVCQAREVILRDAGDYGRSFLSADIAKPPDEVYESPHGIHVSGGG